MQARAHPSECRIGDFILLIDLVDGEVDAAVREGFTSGESGETIPDVEFVLAGETVLFQLKEVPSEGGTDFAWVRTT